MRRGYQRQTREQEETWNLDEQQEKDTVQAQLEVHSFCLVFS